jgi:hypothetical protein
MRGVNAAAVVMQQSLEIDTALQNQQTAVQMLMKETAYQTPEEALIQLKMDMKEEVHRLIERRFNPIEEWVQDFATMTRHNSKTEFDLKYFKVKPIDVKSGAFPKREFPKREFQPTDDALERAVEDISEKPINAAPVRRLSSVGSMPKLVPAGTVLSQEEKKNPSTMPKTTVEAGHRRGRRLSVLLETQKDGGALQEEEFPIFFWHPQSQFLKYWNGFLMLFVVYIAIFLPLRLSLSLSTSRFQNALDIMLDLFFLADVVLNFRTGYIDSKTKVVVFNPRDVARRYVSGWFFVDLISSLPVSLISMGDTLLEDFIVVKLLRILKLFRLFRLIRLEVLKELEYKGIFPPGFIRLTKFLIIFLFSLHLITCFFWMVPGESEDAPSEGGSRKNIPVLKTGETVFQRYVLGFYWALVSSLGNDFALDSIAQRLYSTLVLFSGIFLYAIIVGSASSLMSNLDHNAALKKRQMDDINYYMMFHKIPQELQNKVRAYYDYQWSQGIGAQDEAVLFYSLSNKWQTRLQMAVKSKFVQNVPMFKEVESNCVEALVLKLKPLISLPMEAIITQGDTSGVRAVSNHVLLQCFS